MNIRKKVNGKVVEIEDIELFEKASEGILMQNMAINNTSDKISKDIKGEKINKIIKQYDLFYNSMPYPLYAIEEDIKYVILANFIKTLNKNDELLTWVDGGLYIQIDKELKQTIHLINNTWSLTTIEAEDDNTDLDEYSNVLGYEQYKWYLDKIINKDNNINYYETFMNEFYKACNSNDMVLMNEISNILNFCPLPERLYVNDNVILDMEKQCEYKLDIYETGYIDTEDEIKTWDLSGSKIKSGKRFKRMKTYGYDAYIKALNKDLAESYNLPENLTSVKLQGIQQLFLTLTGLRNAKHLSSFPDFKGVIVNNQLVYITDGSLYITKSNRMAESKELARGVELFGVGSNLVYFTKTKRINSMIVREAVYSLTLSNESIRLCNIEFKLKV